MSRNEDYQLPLQFAVRNHQAEMVALLVELGADPLGIDGSGHFAADYATQVGVDRAVMEAIRVLTGHELASAQRGGRAPDLRFHDRLAAIALHDFDLAEVVPGALHAMAKRGDLDAVAWLLDHGAPPNATWTHWGAEVTALHLAAAHGHTAVVRALVDGGADPTIRDSMHDSDALGWATYFNQAEVIALLKRDAPEDPINVVLEFAEQDPHVSELVDAFGNGWVVGIDSRGGFDPPRARDARGDLGRGGDARRVAARPAPVRLALTRRLPAALGRWRTWISWTAQVLPSGSLKKVKRPHGNSCTSLASTPRDTRSARASSALVTTTCRPLTEPGVISVTPSPIVIEHAEPGGVSWTKRRFSLTRWS